MSAKPETIADMVCIFDAVIPGYAWAWHDANAPKTGGWRDRRRTRLRDDRDRCLLVYGMWPKGDEVVFYNRGYLELASVRFPSTERAVEELMVFATERCRRRWREDHETSFYDDACEFAERTAISLRTLDYVRQHAIAVQPLWQGGDLKQSS